MSDEICYGIVTQEEEKTSYIYLVNIKPEVEINIAPNVKLVPVETDPAPDDMIDCIMKNGNGDEYALGQLISTLRRVTAQLVVTAENAEELAIATWNAQTICVLISAMLNCEVAWYFQANKSADRFDSETRVSLISPYMQKIPSEEVLISKDQCQYLEKNMDAAWRLNDDERFGNAANALWVHLLSPRPAIQLSIIWGGIESMFLIERGIREKLSKAISRFLSGNDNMVEKVKALYGFRCKAVHEFKNSEKEAVAASRSLLHKLIRKCIETNSLPEVEPLLEEKTQ